MHFYSPAIREMCLIKAGIIFIASCLKMNGGFMSIMHQRISVRYLTILKGRCENHFTRAQCHIIPSMSDARWLILGCLVKERWSLVRSSCNCAVALNIRESRICLTHRSKIYFYMYLKNILDFLAHWCVRRGNTKAINLPIADCERRE